MLHRFEDEEIEREYVIHERAARIPGTRFLAGMGIATLVSYLCFNPLHFPREGVVEYAVAAGNFIAVLVAVIALSFTRFYVERSWIDIVIFTGLAVPMAMLIDALAGQAAITGISHFGMAVINLGMLMVFASVGFVAATRYFLVWAFVLLGLYFLFLLHADRTLVAKVYTFTNFGTFFVFACFVNWDIDRRARRTFAAGRALAEEQAKSERLLHNVLPSNVVARLNEGEDIADSYAEASFVFIDIVGSSMLARTLRPERLVELLGTVFLIADRAAERHRVEKVKTIGDAYLAVCGGNASAGSGAAEAVAFALEVIENLRLYSAQTGIGVAVRVGIHTGPVVGGVIGTSKLAYDYWGETVTVASRIERVAEPGGIALSERTFQRAGACAEFVGPETALLRNIGATRIYRLRGSASEPAALQDRTSRPAEFGRAIA